MTADVATRIKRTRSALAAAGVDGLIVTPGSDLRYLTGYAAPPLERLTALVLSAHDDPILVVPELERAEAERSPAALAGMQITTHGETDDAYALALSGLSGAREIAVDDHLWAARLLRLQAVLSGRTWRSAGRLLSDLRLRKGTDEVASLRRAGAAIDRVHHRMEQLLKVGETEREAAARIAVAIVEEGHTRSDFVIVASGPNAASPHHRVSERVLTAGDVVVVDIGGTTPDGYRSDCTRTYTVAREADEEVVAYYDVLLEAQRTQCDFAGPGVTAEAVDRVGRSVIRDGGYGEHFMHRTGHGIGLDTHEEPYIVEGNTLVLEPGMVFSIEPGIYLRGKHGARIEDIVVTTAGGIERLNTTTRELTTVAG